MMSNFVIPIKLFYLMLSFAPIVEKSVGLPSSGTRFLKNIHGKTRLPYIDKVSLQLQLTVNYQLNDFIMEELMN